MEEFVHVCAVHLSAALSASHSSIGRCSIVEMRKRNYQHDSSGVGVLLAVAAQRERGSI